MREIKYKAYWHDSKLMTTVDTIEFLNDGTRVSDGCMHTGLVGKDCELIEYTGLKDKNGVEIYDGYIVKMRERTINGSIFTHIFQVYQHESGLWRMEGTCTSGGIKLPKTSMGLYSNLSRVEIIGSRFGNPDLLGGSS